MISNILLRYENLVRLRLRLLCVDLKNIFVTLGARQYTVQMTSAVLPLSFFPLDVNVINLKDERRQNLSGQLHTKVCARQLTGPVCRLPIGAVRADDQCTKHS